jgi:hypothetical protein
MTNEDSLKDDGFDRLMQLQGWRREDFTYEAVERNRNVIGQVWEGGAPSWSRNSPQAFFFQFGDTTFRKLLRHLFFHRQSVLNDLSNICSNITILKRHLTYLSEQQILVQDGDLWKISPRYEHIQDLGKTLEWYVAEWFCLNLQVPGRYGVHVKGLAKGGDLDVVGFITEKPVMVECKTSVPDALGDEELHLFLQRVAYFKPLKALLLLDTDKKIDALSERLRRIYVASDLIGPFTSSESAIDIRSIYVCNTRKGIQMALSTVLDHSQSDCDQPLANMSDLDVHKRAGIVPGLQRGDSQVLKILCEKTIETTNDWIDTTDLRERARKFNITEERFIEALDVLERRGFIKRHAPATMEILIDGFEAYATIYLDNYAVIKREVASAVANGGITLDFHKRLAVKLNYPLRVIEHVLSYLDKKKFIKLINYQGGWINIINIAPSLKRAVRDGTDM